MAWMIYLTLAVFSFVAQATGVETGIDLLESLQLHNSSRPGVSFAPGPQRLKPAFYLQGDFRDLRLPTSIYQRAVDLLRRNPEFTLAASIRQEESNSGTIVSFSHGYNRYLEVESSGRKDEIRLHYISKHDSLVHVETFPYRLADNTWHKVAVSVSGAQVEVLVDCHTLYRRLIRPPDRNFTFPQLTLWIGQRNNKHSLFKGAIQDVRLVTGPHGYLTQCPHLNSSCPTCGQFSLLQNKVETLTRHLQELSERLVEAEGRISRVEECDCQKSCRVNGTVHPDGTRWQKDCDICACLQGEIQCRPVHCSNINCKNPVLNPGECCPKCLKQCYLQGVMYDHGESMNLRECLECECRDGSMKCNRNDPEITCPALTCPTNMQFSVPGECCKFCPGVDYCTKGHMCHANASCLNLQTTYACQCSVGFYGDGHVCHDVDECKQEGGLEGHHCHSNTKCLNTVGSYVCECLPGYRRLDKFNCIELDECSTGEHECHRHANCINTQGSYHCQCHHGYTGDGYECHPVCNQTCLNGGECLTPGHCTCRKGYVGPSCELDLDECSTELHRCHQTAECVNMPGWSYCRCKPGYRSILHGTTLGTLCQDIDECVENTHTCHPSARCVNNEGGFRCACPHPQLPDCKLNCMFEGKEVSNGITLSPSGQPCRRCTCREGVMSCKDPTCDCSLRGSASDKCCPQCDPAAMCRHQELKHVVFRSGEKWIYQCLTCECLYGEVDCWPMECPPVTCSDPILSPGDCCPRCEDDPCALELSTNSTTIRAGQPCTYAGQLYDSGTEWHDSHDKCTACNCKDGRLCCSYDVRCAASADESSRAVNGRQVDQSSTPPVDTHQMSSQYVHDRRASEAQIRSVNETDRQLKDKGSNETSSRNNSETMSLLSATAKTIENTGSFGNNSAIVYVSDNNETEEGHIGHENNSTSNREMSRVRRENQVIRGIIREDTLTISTKDHIRAKRKPME